MKTIAHRLPKLSAIALSGACLLASTPNGPEGTPPHPSPTAHAAGWTLDSLLFSAELLSVRGFEAWGLSTWRALPSMGAAAMPSPLHPGDCDQIAFIARWASMDDARSDALFSFANCINAGHDLFRCIIELSEEYDEAIELAHEQYDARVEVCDLLGGGTYSPEIDPDDFSAVIDNPYFPFVAGRTLVYEGLTEDGLEVIEVTALDETVEINGIECLQVRDVVSIDGEVLEDTIDWYSQDEDGNVWYIGEISLNFENGLLEDVEGSWRFGVESAEPGILMHAAPCPGDVYRQEYLLDEAEDLGAVISLGETVTVPYGTFDDCLQTEDFTPLEPDASERKFYAKGIGPVLEVDPDTGEMVRLVNIIDG